MASIDIIKKIDEGIDSDKKEQIYEAVGCRSKTREPNKDDCKGCPLYRFRSNPDFPGRAGGIEVSRSSTDVVIYARSSEPGTHHCKIEDYVEYRKKFTKLLNKIKR